jgi:hypothetical protein
MRIFLPSAAGRIAFMAAPMTSESAAGRSCRRSLPVMMRETSSRSSMSFACAMTLRSMTSSPSRSLGAPGRSERRRRVQPRIADNGVRSSCDSVVKNSSFMRLASRASALIAFSMAIELICASWVRIASSSTEKSPDRLPSRYRIPIGRPSRPESCAASHPADAAGSRRDAHSGGSGPRGRRTA